MQESNLGDLIKVWPLSYFIMLETIILVGIINVFS